MTDTRRATSVFLDGSPSSRIEGIASQSPLPAAKRSLRPGQSKSSFSPFICQGMAGVGQTARRIGRSSAQRRITFAEIRYEVRSTNVARLKDHAFAANRLAKITVGTSRCVCYRVKSRCINALLRNGAAVVSELDMSFGKPTIGIAFEDGGRLHTMPSSLDSQARNVLHQQLTLVINGGDSSMAGIASL
jgi:hypothetical protein